MDIFTGYEFSHSSFLSLKCQHCLVCSKWFYSALQKNYVKFWLIMMWLLRQCLLVCDVMQSATQVLIF